METWKNQHMSLTLFLINSAYPWKLLVGMLYVSMVIVKDTTE